MKEDKRMKGVWRMVKGFKEKQDRRIFIFCSKEIGHQ
jgi:hypothetical protein